MKPAVTTVILAAGAGERLGGPKALATLGQQTFLERIVGGLPPDFRPLCVVGAQASQVVERHRNLDVAWTENPAWNTSDMLQSLILALDWLAAHDSDHDVVLVWPVDAPFADPHIPTLLVDALTADSQALAALPVHEGQPGHPVALSLLATRALRGGRWPHLRAWLQEHPTIEVPVQQPAILRNINTIEDLEGIPSE